LGDGSCMAENQVYIVEKRVSDVSHTWRLGPFDKRWSVYKDEELWKQHLGGKKGEIISHYYLRPAWQRHLSNGEVASLFKTAGCKGINEQTSSPNLQT